jgi:hypothetical protein
VLERVLDELGAAGPWRTTILGGTSHALVRRAACPVLVVPRGTAARITAALSRRRGHSRPDAHGCRAPRLARDAGSRAGCAARIQSPVHRRAEPCDDVLERSQSC